MYGIANCCYRMSHCLCSGLVELTVIVQDQHIDNRKYSNFCTDQDIFLYGCETWSLTLWEERKLRVFENMVLRKIFGQEG